MKRNQWIVIIAVGLIVLIFVVLPEVQERNAPRPTPTPGRETMVFVRKNATYEARGQSTIAPMGVETQVQSMVETQTAPTWTPIPTRTPLPTHTAIPTNTPAPTHTLIPTRTPPPTIPGRQTQIATQVNGALEDQALDTLTPGPGDATLDRAAVNATLVKLGANTLEPGS